MGEEYSRIVRKFYEVYRPLQKRYNLRCHMHFDTCEKNDGLIEIWEYKGETRGKCIVRAKETEEIDCYKRAIDELKNYMKEREEITHGKRTDMVRRGLAC